ncbi:hypothetical protein [Gordonia hankookensis]|uniref:Uncharacterized protein n=1 Tax=Gordonia hankookensis TaxID=589403 RepID=A0ABR7WFL4_9ACTN|nr:hypothetical protein [Gordonia hankookensis]MBD1320672.1 hypothetical protein [Gordonia hankookensis]
MSYFAVTVCAIVLGAWWVVSAIHQIDSGRWTRRIRRRIPLGLLPGWTFFAPNPARSDSRLIWREYVDGAHGGWLPWKELHFGFAPPHRRWLWNPELVLNKAISDLANNLPSGDEETASRTTLISASYVVLLSAVVRQVENPETVAIQFALVTTSWDGADRHNAVSFLGEEHDLGAQSRLRSADRVHPS